MAILTAKSKFYYGLVWLLSFAVFIVIGQYAGGAYFLNETSISMEYLNHTTLYQNWVNYINHPDFKKILSISAAIACITAILPLLIGAFLFYLFADQEELHGSAKFATDSDLKKSGLFPNSSDRSSPSILLGKMPNGRFAGKYIELLGQQFAGVAAPTRSGKGVSVVLPNLVTYTDSVVVLDIKLENFMKSGGFRKKYNHEVFLFCPSGYNPSGAEGIKDIRSHCWNPFDYVRRHEAFRVGDILIMTNSLFPLTGDKNDMWQELAGKLFKGLALWMLDTENIKKKTPTLPYMLSLTGVNGGLVKWMKHEISLGYLSNETIAEFNNFMDAPNETRGSILSNFVSPLAVFGDKVAAAAVSKSDFDLRELRKKKMALYVGVEPASLSKFSKLINLFFEQLINENTRTLPEQDPSLKYQCLLLMDEFTSIGRVPQIAKSISFTAGYNLRFLLIYQNEAQLEERESYGKEGAKNIKDNLAARIIFPPKEVDESVKRLSDTLGTKTVKIKNKSISRGKSSSTSRTSSLQKRPLMIPHEICDLGNQLHPTAPLGVKTIFIKENQRPFIMDKIFYFDEPLLLERVKYSQANIPPVPLLEL